MRTRNISLRWKFLLFSTGSILVILALLSYFGISAARASTQQTLSERLILCEQVAHNVDFNIQQAFRQIGANGPVDLAKDASGNLVSTDFLKNIRRLLPFEVQYIYLMDSQGTVVLTEPSNTGLIGTNMSQNEYIKTVLESKKPLVSNIEFDNSVNSYVAYIVTPVVIQGNESPPMVISAAIDLSDTSLGHLINISSVGKTGYVEIVDGKGMVLATSNPENILKMSDHGGVFAELIRNHRTAVSTCHSCHDAAENQNREKEIITFAPLSAAPWGVVFRQPEEEALATTRILQERLIIFSLAALIILLPAIWYAARNITTPINKLTVASRKIASGSLDETVAMPGKDEISVLAQSFDTMRIKLKDSMERTQQRTTELEGLNGIALAACQSLDLDAILGGALKRVMEIIKVQTGGILLLDGKSRKLSFRVQQGFSDKFLKQTGDLELNESVEGAVAKSGEPVIINDVHAEPSNAYPVAAEEGISAFICFPLRSKDKIIGVMDLASRKPRSFTPGDKQLLFSIANQISIAIENAKLYEDLRDKEQLLTELLKNSISVQEEERKRIARELHDETSQALTTLAIGLETIAKSPPADIEQLKLGLKKNQDLTIKILDDVHRLILDLRPSILDDLGLIPALQWYAQNRLEPEGIKVCLETSGTEKRLPPHIEVALFRIAQEAISNIAQHSHAEFASITLDFDSHSIKLTVEDDGIGFESGGVLAGRNDMRAFGLLGMIERAETLSGNLNIKSGVGTGTQISIEIPVNWN